MKDQRVGDEGPGHESVGEHRLDLLVRKAGRHPVVAVGDDLAVLDDQGSHLRPGSV